jgi:hypothetical protein
LHPDGSQGYIPARRVFPAAIQPLRHWQGVVLMVWIGAWIGAWIGTAWILWR